MKAITSLLENGIANFKRRYLHRPELKVKILPGDGHYSKKRWLSNTQHPSGKPMYIYEVCWSYKLIIKNTSRFDAFYPKIQFDRTLPYLSRLDILNHYVPICRGEKIVLNGEYTIFQECVEDEDIKPSGIPSEVTKLKVLLSYKNADKTPFYTTFDLGQELNTQHRFKPSGFE